MLKHLSNWKRLLMNRHFPIAQVRGQGLVEYSLILVLVSVVSVGILSIMGQEVSVAFEETVCSLDDGEDCECRVIEKVVVSEYSCTASDLFAYTASTTCGADTELSLLADSSSSNNEYAMSYNPSTELFEMTNNTSLCGELSAASPPQLYLVSRHSSDDGINTFRLGANGTPQTGTVGSSSGSGDSGSGDSGSGDSGSGDSGSGDSGSGDSGSGDSGSGSSGSGDSGSGDSGSGSSGSGDSGSGDSGSGSSGSGSSGDDDNTAPVMSAVGTQTVDEDSSKTVTFTATDADDDTLTFGAVGDLPSFMTFVASADPPSLTIEPSFSDSGTYSVTIGVIDNNGGSDSVTFDVVVTNVNQPPVLAAIGAQTVNETETTTVTLSATDADGDTLTTGLSGSLPSFVTVDSSANPPTFTLAPSYDDAGTYSLTAYVTDTAGESDTETFNIVVENTNRDPFISSVSTQVMDEGATLTVDISASDADSDSLTLSASNTQDFMTFTQSGTSATLQLSPDLDDSGTYDVTVTANDGTSTYSITVSIEVNDVASNAVSFIVDDASSLNTSDSAIKSRLENSGYTVNVYNATAGSSTVLANSPVLLIISESVVAGDIGSRFLNTAVAAIVMERQLYDDMKMANTNGRDTNESQVKIVNESHAMAAGLSAGNRTVTTSNRHQGYGDPNNNNVTFIATIDNNTNRGTIFIYDTGTTMENSVKAPARRVGFFAYRNAAEKFNSNGWNLFDAAVAWATGG